MLKKELRQTVLARMQGLDKREKYQKDLLLLESVLSSKAYQESHVITTYLAMPNEYKTALLIQEAQKDGKRILVPKTYPKGKMIFVDYDPKDLVRTSFGLLEPRSDVAVPKEMIDVIHVPGVAFNPDGFRIGYGAGYYDRYLSDYSGKTFSTIYACQQMAFQPEEHDVAVQEVFCQ